MKFKSNYWEEQALKLIDENKQLKSEIETLNAEIKNKDKQIGFLCTKVDSQREKNKIERYEDDIKRLFKATRPHELFSENENINEIIELTYHRIVNCFNQNDELCNANVAITNYKFI